MVTLYKTKTKIHLPYDPAEFPRELSRHYISASKEDIANMLDSIGLTSTDELFKHIAESLQFRTGVDLPDELTYEDAVSLLAEIGNKTNLKTSFIGDSLPFWKTHPIVDFVSNLRSLSTSYTPYQPERSQGTLVTHWIYQCVMSTLTGFEAINTSLYDRSAAIYEAITCATRTNKKGGRILLSSSLFDSELDVVRTLSEETDLKFSSVPTDPLTGLINYEWLKNLSEEDTQKISAFVFPQVNSLGLLEDVNFLSDFSNLRGIRSIACIDPMLLGTGGLKPPTDFGEKGADFIVGEAQHLAIAPNFGGPGLGIFGCRHNDQNKKDLRSTPGRYIGKAKDFNGRDCFVMVLSTREQHIRKEKATSNVCSNQAFLATLAGASLLAKGENGLSNSILKAKQVKERIEDAINKLDGIHPAFYQTSSFNELLLQTDLPISELEEKATLENLQIGVNVTGRINKNDKRNLVKLTFTDVHDEDSILKLIGFFDKKFPPASCKNANVYSNSIDSNLLRTDPVNLASFSFDELTQYYEKLADLNVSPDDGCYPLGSCTMKYNPLLNDWASSLPGFTHAHPQSPESDVQGPLEVLYEIQEWFKNITGLPGVTTQPVAGAQGELVGLKLFQAYHRSRDDDHRDVIFIPKSAHGTNFATATMAGFTNQDGIVYLQATTEGLIDLDDFQEKLQKYATRLCGVMITNPNTSGIFEKQFHLISKSVQQVGGLVYMDGANMNAIAGKIDLGKLGVDAVHNNLHKTWTIPHGGGGPGDAIVAVSEKLIDFLPGSQIIKDSDGSFRSKKPIKSIGSFHRNWGNFAHKVRAYSYLVRLGKEGVPRMSEIAVLSARYLYEKLKDYFPTLPSNAGLIPRMHEFILTLSDEDFLCLDKVGISKSQAIPQVGKLFLDFGFHAPTVAFPEIFGLMIEPTESYTKSELDRFIDAVICIKEIISECPEAVKSAPHFTPIDRVDEVAANRNLILQEKLDHLPSLHLNRIKPSVLKGLEIREIKSRIIDCVKN
ncbi:MAG: aminomethyl-transferring glycine dehydrogenase subunit GcvPB [Opitutae bacterium]|nr:aminomethyl-transferring glycine dehydrogenase subunit GcvPB [Opitutae bacterium]